MNQSSFSVHPSAIIGKSVIIEDDVVIGPYCVVDGDIVLKSGVKLHSHVCIAGKTHIGSNTEIFPFAAIGYRPQDLKYNGEESCVIIGKNNIIREYVTIQPGTEKGIMRTIVGDNCLFMVSSHIAHDCVVGDRVILANSVALAGHVEVGDNVVMGGLSGAHQFVKIGKHAMIGAMTAVREDVIPFGVVVGALGYLKGVNSIGMKRANFSKEQINEVSILFQKIFFEGDGVMSDRVESATKAIENGVAIDVINFIKDNMSAARAICMPKSRKK